jgi:ATP-dependent DNA ligase
MSRPVRIAAARRECPATFYAFDILVHDGVDLRRPLVERKRVLGELIGSGSVLLGGERPMPSPNRACSGTRMTFRCRPCCA